MLNCLALRPALSEKDALMCRKILFHNTKLYTPARVFGCQGHKLTIPITYDLKNVLFTPQIQNVMCYKKVFQFNCVVD